MIKLLDNVLSLEEFTEFTGLDLQEELASKISNLNGNASNVFIAQIEDVIKAVYRFTWNGDITCDNMEKCFKKAVIYQILYELQSGSLWNDSGYSMTSGLIIAQTDLEKVILAPMTKAMMQKGGMANLLRGE